MSSDKSQSSRRRNEYLQRYWQDLTLSTNEEEDEEPLPTLDVNMEDLVELHDQVNYNNVEQFDKMIIDLPWNTKVNTKNSLTDPILSQKITSLSSTSTTNNTLSMIMKDIQAEIEKIPNYLTKRNKSFQQIIHEVQSRITATANTTDRLEELRKIAILIYKIMILQTYNILWTTYLRSGNETNENEIYFNFVKKQLDELDHQLKQYQTELNIKANNFYGYTLTIQKILETYIEQNLQSFRMKIEHQIELLHYDYHIRASKLEYCRYQPTLHQKQLMKQICQSKYNQETTEQEYHFVQYQINYYNSLSQSFECSAIAAQSTLINSIQNRDIQQELFRQYRNNAVQSRTNLFNLYLKSAEDQREEYKKKYEEDMKQMWCDHQSLNHNQHISLPMIQLIEQRCQKISERIQCIYRFKAQSIPNQLF